MGVVVAIIEDTSIETFKNKMENELRQFHSGGAKTDVKFATSRNNNGTIFYAMIIASTD